jgi:hypothetical protein
VPVKPANAGDRSGTRIVMPNISTPPKQYKGSGTGHKPKAAKVLNP